MMSCISLKLINAVLKPDLVFHVTLDERKNFLKMYLKRKKKKKKKKRKINFGAKKLKKWIMNIKNLALI